MERFISIVIPNHNGGATIGRCIETALASRYGRFELVVVDDCSTDGSVDLIKRFPCRFIGLPEHAGASAARNRGAQAAKGEILFFIDADCLIRDDALMLANEAMTDPANTAIGGTYTPLPDDADFFSAFQSLFIHYSETKKNEPDYLATHALVISADLFRKTGGFREEFLPILEDVEFSHRLRRAGCRLVMKPEIQVTHMFNFTFRKSFRNAFRKSRYWIRYSLANRDLLSDSGTASRELKVDMASFFLTALFAVLIVSRRETALLLPLALVYTANLLINRGLFKLFYRTKGAWFTVRAVLYYTLLYPLPVGAGAFAGILKQAKHALIRGAKRVTIF